MFIWEQEGDDGEEGEEGLSAVFFFFFSYIYSDAIVSTLIICVDARGSRTVRKCCIRAGEERGRKRITRGCYETKPRECALIFMSLWV